MSIIGFNPLQIDEQPLRFSFPNHAPTLVELDTELKAATDELKFESVRGSTFFVLIHLCLKSGVNPCTVFFPDCTQDSMKVLQRMIQLQGANGSTSLFWAMLIHGAHSELKLKGHEMNAISKAEVDFIIHGDPAKLESALRNALFITML